MILVRSAAAQVTAQPLDHPRPRLPANADEHFLAAWHLPFVEGAGDAPRHIGGGAVPPKSLSPPVWKAMAGYQYAVVAPPTGNTGRNGGSKARWADDELRIMPAKAIKARALAKGMVGAMV